MYKNKSFCDCCGYKAAAMTLLLTLMLAGCGDNQPEQEVSLKPANFHKVEVTQVEKLYFHTVYSVPGTIVPSKRLQITSRVTGYIKEISVDEGDIVEPGVILVKIDNAQVEASIKSAEAGVASAQAELDEAHADVKRFKRLVSSKTITEDQLRKAMVRQTSAKAKLTRALAELKSNQQEQQYTHITSPVRAQVRERLQDPGDLASAASPILRLDVLGPMELEAYLPSTRIGNVAIGQNVDVYIQSEQNPLTGTVKSVVRAADKVTRSSKVRIALPEKQSLSPGQFGRADIVLGKELLTAIPLEARTERAGIEGVFIVDEDDAVHFRSVQLGREYKDYQEILAGPEAGAAVVLNPPAQLHENDRVMRVSLDGR
ncbi:MAG: efflux RND transporter periplasmic adaptor subunit [Pseudomonadota bacterium]|nr:efflux RND transporter periplasmic adaptor subunit [Pseudomonadota bacterium]